MSMERIYVAVNLEVISSEPEWLLSVIRGEGVDVYDVRMKDSLTLKFTVTKGDLPTIGRICDKCGASVRLVEKLGFYWILRNFRNRHSLLFVLSLLLAATMILPGRILFIHVEGNQKVDTQRILDVASDLGIGFGCSRAKIRSEALKNSLLEYIPQLQWAGINTHGCVAIISVEERQENLEPAPNDPMTKIVASRSGIVEDITVLRGNQLCTVGQTVEMGQTLVSGFLETGDVIRVTGAQGEILARTEYDLIVINPHFTQARGKCIGNKTDFSLIFGKKLIKLYSGSGISYGTCVKMYSTYTLALPGGFQLPVQLLCEKTEYYDCEHQVPVYHETCGAGEVYAADYLKNQMIAGCILDSNFDSQINGDACIISCKFQCKEMIGRVQNEEIMEYHGKGD